MQTARVAHPHGEGGLLEVPRGIEATNWGGEICVQYFYPALCFLGLFIVWVCLFVFFLVNPVCGSLYLLLG